MKQHRDYQLIQKCKNLDIQFHFGGKSVLDVGCGRGPMVKIIASEYSPRMILGVDPTAIYEKGENYEIKKGDARNLEFEDNSFDLVYSHSTFEHIHGIAETLSEMKRVLKPYGKAYISFAPVWTSVCGHHSYNCSANFTDECVARGDDIDENIVFAVPAWGHLYMGEDEMRQHLHDVHFQENRIENLVDCIYHNDFINRVPVSQIRENIMKSGMIIRNFSEGVNFSREWALGKWAVGEKGKSEMTPEIASRIEKAGYSVLDTGIVSMVFVLEKYECI